MRIMGKTTTKAQRKTAKWAKINTARDFKMSHTEGKTFKASDREYTVRADGRWKRQ